MTTAAYPTSIRQFTPKQDLVDDVFAAHVNDLQDEVSSIESLLGVNVHLSDIFAQSPTLAARLAADDVRVSQLLGYFHGNGLVSQAQVDGLLDALGALSQGVSDAATSQQLAQSVSDLSAALQQEAGTRAAADTALAGQVTALSQSTTSSLSALDARVTQEVSDRTAALGTEHDQRVGGDNALSARTSVLEAMVARAETQRVRNAISNYASSASYQDLFLPDSVYLTSDYPGHTLVDTSGVRTRFYTDSSGAGDLYCMTVTVTWKGDGGSANSGSRGVRIVTAGGSTLAENIRAANPAQRDDILTVTYIGRAPATAGYFWFPQVLQDSGGGVILRGHTPQTPTTVTFARLRG